MWYEALKSPGKTRMFGFQEILIVVALVLGVLFIPRMMAPKQPLRSAVPKIRLSGKTRIAVAAAFLYPALAAAYFQPWRKEPLLFFYMGIGPVVLGWLLWWVFQGFKKK